MGNISLDESAALEREISDAADEFSRDMERIRGRREELLESWMKAVDERRQHELTQKIYGKES